MSEHLKSDQILSGRYLDGGKLVKKGVTLDIPLHVHQDMGRVGIQVADGPTSWLEPTTARRLAVEILRRIGYHMVAENAGLTVGLD
jgi:hypothetical protein